MKKLKYTPSIVWLFSILYFSYLGVVFISPPTSKVTQNSELRKGADYAEYFIADHPIPKGFLVGMNNSTGNVRHYLPGDDLVGIVSTRPAVVGNSDMASRPNAVLVGLVGQLKVESREIYIEDNRVYTIDLKPVGYLLASNEIYINMSSADSVQNRQIDGLRKQNHRLSENQKALTSDVQGLSETNFILRNEIKEIQKALGL